MNFFGCPIEIEKITIDKNKDKNYQSLSMTILYGYATSFFGEALFLETKGKLCGLSFFNSGENEIHLEEIKKIWPNASFKHSTGMEKHYGKRLFSKKNPQEKLDLFLMGTQYALKTWEALLDIPCGQTRSYHDIGKKIGKHPRPVGAWLGCNPIAWVVPCHRILGADGSMTGYHWGIDRKKKMLNYEQSLLKTATKH